MMRTSPLVLIIAFAVSACGNDAGGEKGNAAAGETVAPAASRPASAPPTGAAPAVQPAGAARVPLQPLSESDMARTTQMGCNCMFDSRDGRYLLAIGRELMVRTAAGLQICPITDAQFQSLAGSGGDVSCGGVRISIRQTGARDSSPESDSSSAPATLSASQGGVTGTLDGSFGCAC